MSAPWVSGGRVASRILERHLAAALLRASLEPASTRVARECGRIWRHASSTIGPASGAAAVWMHLVRPCADALGWSPGDAIHHVLAGVPVRIAPAGIASTRLLLVTLPWGATQDGLQRPATRAGVEKHAAWVSVCNGTSWRWFDTSRPYAREHLGIDLTQAHVDGRVWQALWLLTRPSPRGGRTEQPRVWIEHVITASAAEAAGSASVMRQGVARTLAEMARHVPAAHDDHVAQVFQWLFLLFAEARDLLPSWHPVYRRSYALSGLAGSTAAGPPAMGVHESAAAIATAGRQGLALGSIDVTAVNGPLFDRPLLARPGRRLPDALVSRWLTQITRGVAPGELVVDLGELGVEHLGSLYEHLMAPPAPAGAPALDRKRTGAFYTPRGLADLLVQRTLEPLVRDVTSEQILSLRILDPAMGSGALLAGTLRYLVGAVEAAWVREGRGGPLDIPVREREQLPRRIAEQCLYGVDLNPRAAQVARLSIWLLSMAPDRPLTWLDAHLRVGNSLIGASPTLVLGRTPVRDRAARTRHDAQPTLFDLSLWHHEAVETGALLRELTSRPTDSGEDARGKSRAFAALRNRDGLSTWRLRADAWCGAAMDPSPSPAALWRRVDDTLRNPANSQPGRHVDACAERWTLAAKAEGCLHWSLEFPDVFDAGRGGFDAVIANPPWEMLRADLGSGSDRAARRGDIGPLLRFVRRSGVYRDVGGHVNSYQLFVERMLHLLRPGGRLGCLLPGSLLADHGSAPLRRHLFDHAAVDRLSILENREGLFPIHRSMRIIAVSATAGGTTDSMVVDGGEELQARSRNATGNAPRLITRTFLRRASADAEAIPHLRDGADLRLLERLLAWPKLAGAEWRLRFGRELNATDDRALLSWAPSVDRLIVVDGKHVRPFGLKPPTDGPWVREQDAGRALAGEPWRRRRLAYRDVSSPTNTRSLIVTILPVGCVSTHTVFCLRTPLPLPTQLYLCGMLNSLVADWFVRRYLGSHVTTRLIAMLPVPRLTTADPRRRRLVRLTARLMRHADDERAAAEHQALAACIYGLGREELAHVADDFPRLPPAVRDRMLGVLAAG